MTLDRGETILAAEGLRHEFLEASPIRRPRRIQALRGVGMELNRGECLALVGESGSGKTTLARVLLRLIHPNEGSVYFHGEDVLGMTTRDLMGFRKRVQIVFQDPYGSLNPRIRAGRMLEEVLHVHGSEVGPAGRRERVVELLSMVGLPETAIGRYPHEFSGGQRQRLCIARALSVEPEVLILDEPVSALDLSVQAQILNLLQELQEQLALTYLFISHDLSVVRHVADRVAVLYMGRIVECAPTESLFDEPLHPYSRGLLAAATTDDSITGDEGRWEHLPGEPPSSVEPPLGCAFHPRCPHPSKSSKCQRVTPFEEGLGSGRRVACFEVNKQVVNP